MTPGEKKAFVVGRRKRGSGQATSETKKKIALELKYEGKTQAEIGKLLGAKQNTVSRWFPIIEPDNSSSPPDNRRKLSDEDRKEIIELARSGQGAQGFPCVGRAGHATADRRDPNRGRHHRQWRGGLGLTWPAAGGSMAGVNRCIRLHN